MRFNSDNWCWTPDTLAVTTKGDLLSSPPNETLIILFVMMGSLRRWFIHTRLWGIDVIWWSRQLPNGRVMTTKPVRLCRAQIRLRTMETKCNPPDNTHASDSFLMYFVSEWKFWCTSGDWLKDKEPLVFGGRLCDVGDHFTSIPRHSVRVVDECLPLWARILPRPLCNYHVINRLLCAYHFAAA